MGGAESISRFRCDQNRKIFQVLLKCFVNFSGDYV